MLKYYVITFDTTKNYVTDFYEKDLNLSDAISAYDKATKDYQNHINVMLGVSYPNGSVDILQRIDGKIRLSTDYQYFAIKDEISDTIETLKEKYNLL